MSSTHSETPETVNDLLDLFGERESSMGDKLTQYEYYLDYNGKQ